MILDLERGEVLSRWACAERKPLLYGTMTFTADGGLLCVTGDLDAGGVYALLERNNLPPVELYVAGHHGSGSSSTEALLETIRPETVFISVGRNSYGLPSAAALNRFAACGAKVCRTDESGNLEVSVQ